MGIYEHHPKLRHVGSECPRTKSIRKKFALYIDGEVCESAMNDLEAHILECDSCRTEFLAFTAKLFGKRPPIHTSIAALTAIQLSSENSPSDHSTPSEAAGETAAKEDDFMALAPVPHGQNKGSSLRLLMSRAA